jgi:DNA-binding NtrC family response regulator
MKVFTEAEPKAMRNSTGFPSVTRPEKVVPEQPAFTVMFSPSTPMRDIHDAVIRTVLRFTHGNRSRAAQLLRINPRTIRRHLGRKESDHITALAG